jgi:AraC-like DNA-binding protein
MLLEIYFNYGYQDLILLFFVLSELIFAFLIVRRGVLHKSRPDIWMSMLIFLCAAYLTPWMLGHAGWYAQDGYREILFFIPFHQYFLFGPVMLFLTRSLTEDNWSLRKRDLWHLIPAALYLGYSVIVAVTDLLLLDEFYFYADGRDKDYKQWYQITGLCAMVVYALYCIRLYGAYKIRIYRTLSYADNIRLKWLKQFFIILILIIVLRALFTLLLPEMGDWGVKWWYYFLFGLLSYYLSFSGYTNSLLLNNWRQQPAPSSVDLDEAKSSRVTLPEEKVDQLLERVKDLLLKEKYYKDPTLSLPQLAKEAQTNPSILSKVINEGTGMNFNDFINRYRVEAVKKAFEQGEHQRKTLEGIAWEAGFNSKSTFLRAFKKHTAMTPTQYKNSL